MSYQVPQDIDPNKIFLVNRSEIEGRLEPEFYRPSLASLEKQIRRQSSHKLRDYALYMAGGATPKKTEAEKFYSDSESGIPFLRVQNLQTDGELSLDDCVYINEETHNGLLARSQVAEGDLLVKITGVGRMAVASVAPQGFVGNTNQHMVVLKTGNTELSKYLARYLNLDVVEKVASRHSTGGTRPALDYPSLKNIPVIEGIDFSKIDGAISAKRQKELESQCLIDSIDSYLLEELDVVMPEIKTDLKSRQFIVNRSALEGRLDPSVYKDGIKLVSEKYDNVKLSNCAWINPNTSFKGKDANTPISFIPMEVINESYSEISSMSEKTIGDSYGFTRFQNGDLLWAKITPCMQNGKSAIARNLKNGLGCGSTEFFVLRPKDESLSVEYLHVLLHMKCVRETAMLYFGGSAGQQRVSSTFLKNFDLPLPPKEKQIEIANHVYAMRQQAKALQEEGKKILEQAKKEVEQMIIG
ncbi:MAG: restriction endonuclease subunit S [Bacteroidaceae bacterium]|nr:restriction endonuclease subunit S [Bacteroidaceae bacterium]